MLRSHLDANDHRMLGDAERGAGNLQSALREYDMALAEDDDATDALFGKAITLRMMGRNQQASDTLEQVAAIDPGYPRLSLERAADDRNPVRGSYPGASAHLRGTRC